MNQADFRAIPVVRGTSFAAGLRTPSILKINSLHSAWTAVLASLPDSQIRAKGRLAEIPPEKDLDPSGFLMGAASDGADATLDLCPTD